MSDYYVVTLLAPDKDGHTTESFRAPAPVDGESKQLAAYRFATGLLKIAHGSITRAEVEFVDADDPTVRRLVQTVSDYDMAHRFAYGDR